MRDAFPVGVGVTRDPAPNSAGGNSCKPSGLRYGVDPHPKKASMLVGHDLPLGVSEAKALPLTDGTTLRINLFERTHCLPEKALDFPRPLTHNVQYGKRPEQL